MRLAIMQPYFFPYVGYFQLIAAADVFVVYDNIKYTKKGWINRNRLLRDGRDVTFSLPLKAASDDADVCERSLAADFDRGKLINQIREAYRKAPHFAPVFALVEEIVRFDDPNLFNFLRNSIERTCRHLGLGTQLRNSSTVEIDHTLKGEDKVLALCQAMGAEHYVNAIGGLELYDRERFRAHGVDLKFIKPAAFEYAQFGAPFVPWLSIIDVMMFNAPDTIAARLAHGYELI